MNKSHKNADTTELLRVSRVSAGYPEKTVLNQVDLCLRAGRILAVIGQNGSGKSTLLKTIAGILPMYGGQLFLQGEEVHNLSAHELLDKGISFFPQGGMVLPDLTVQEHFTLCLSSQKRLHANSLSAIYNHFPKLSILKREKAGNLSGGERQLLSFGLLQLQDTGLWLLDEPTAGLSPSMVKKTTAFLSRSNKGKGVSMVLVEHNMEVALQLADEVLVVKDGKVSEPLGRARFLGEGFLDEFIYH